MMAFCLEEEGDVNRDLSSLIVFIAQTQLSPPVPFVCDLSHYYTVMSSVWSYCCCGQSVLKAPQALYQDT